MKLIIAGSRTIIESQALQRLKAFAATTEWMNAKFVTEVVSGGARGPDRAGEAWAKELGIPVRVFRPEWDRYGKRAGLVRNYEMGDYADLLTTVWDQQSRGTLHMIDFMKRLGKPTHLA